jgi:hypothetical protein
VHSKTFVVRCYFGVLRGAQQRNPTPFLTEPVIRTGQKIYNFLGDQRRFVLHERTVSNWQQGPKLPIRKEVNESVYTVYYSDVAKVDVYGEEIPENYCVRLACRSPNCIIELSLQTQKQIQTDELTVDACKKESARRIQKGIEILMRANSTTSTGAK